MSINFVLFFFQNGVIHFSNDRTSNAAVYNNVSRHHVAEKSRQTEYTNVGKKYIVNGNGHNSNHLHNGQSHKVHYADNIGIISTKNSPPSSINELDKKKQREIERKRRRRICTVILLLLLALIIGFGVGLLVYFLLMNGEYEKYYYICLLVFIIFIWFLVIDGIMCLNFKIYAYRSTEYICLYIYL